MGHLKRLHIRVGVEIELISVMGSNLLGFYVRERNNLVLRSGSNFDSFFGRGSKTTSVLRAGRK